MRRLPLTTARADVAVCGVYGQPVLHLYEQMRRLLLQQTGDQVAGEVFAEPQINPLRGEIAWYTRAQGPILPVAALQADERQALSDRLDGIRTQIIGAGQRYIAGGDRTATTRADTVRAMLTITDPERCLFSVGGQPVLAEWGCTLVAGAQRSVDLWTMGALARPSNHGSGDDVPPPAVKVDDSVIPAADASADRASLVQPTESEASNTLPKRPDLAVPVEHDPPLISIPDRPAPHASPSATAKPLHASVTRVAPVEPAPGTYELAGRSPIIAAGPDGSLWPIFKFLLFLLLSLLLLALLVRGCNVATVASSAADSDEERRLRAEIAALRLQASQIAARCAIPGTSP